MPSPAQSGHPRVVLAEGSSLFITSPEGTIKPDEQLGFVVSDTRLLSRYEHRINGRRWIFVSAAPLTSYAARWLYLNPGHRRRGRGWSGTVAMTIDRALRRHLVLEVLDDPPGLLWSYTRGDFARGFSIRVARSDSPPNPLSLRGPR